MPYIIRILPFLFILLIAFGGFFGCKKETPQPPPAQDTTKPPDTTKPVDTTPVVKLTEAQLVEQITRNLTGRKFALSYFATRYRSDSGISSSYRVYNNEFFNADTLQILPNPPFSWLVAAIPRSGNAMRIMDSTLFVPKIYVSENQDSFVGLICNSCSIGYRGVHFGTYHKADTLKPASAFGDYRNYYANNLNPLVPSGPQFEMQYYFRKDSIVFFLRDNFTSYTEQGSLVERRGEYYVMYGKGL